MEDPFEDEDSQSDTGSDLFATAIICIILLITVLITQVGPSRGEVQLPDFEPNWLLIFSTEIEEDDLFVSNTIVSDSPCILKRPVRCPINLKSGDKLSVEIRSPRYSGEYETKYSAYISLKTPTKNHHWGESGHFRLEQDILETDYIASTDGTHWLQLHGDLTEPILDNLLVRTEVTLAAHNAPDSELSRFDNQSVVRIHGGKDWLLPIEQSIANKLHKILGPFGTIKLHRKRARDTKLCLRLTHESATLGACRG